MNAKSKDRSDYASMQRQRSSLPAFKYSETILKAIRDHQVVIIKGETGCGKTTQVPQFILNEAIKAGKGGNVGIICTQPRRIAAIGVAQRVADAENKANLKYEADMQTLEMMFDLIYKLKQMEEQNAE